MRNDKNEFDVGFSDKGDGRVNNHFLLAQTSSGQALFGNLLHRLSYAQYSAKKDVLYSTGPMALTSVYNHVPGVPRCTGRGSNWSLDLKH